MKSGVQRIKTEKPKTLSNSADQPHPHRKHTATQNTEYTNQHLSNIYHCKIPFEGHLLNTTQ